MFLWLHRIYRFFHFILFTHSAFSWAASSFNVVTRQIKELYLVNMVPIEIGINYQRSDKWLFLLFFFSRFFFLFASRTNSFARSFRLIRSFSIERVSFFYSLDKVTLYILFPIAKFRIRFVLLFVFFLHTFLRVFFYSLVVSIFTIDVKRPRCKMLGILFWLVEFRVFSIFTVSMHIVENLKCLCVHIEICINQRRKISMIFGNICINTK